MYILLLITMGYTCAPGSLISNITVRIDVPVYYSNDNDNDNE